MLPADFYVRQMLWRHHLQSLSPESRVPAWERRAEALRRSSPGGRRGGRLRLLMVRLRPAHSGS
jgi:hypothetical protein